MDDLYNAFVIILPERKKERKKDILMSFKRLKWSIRPNKSLHLKCCLVFENKSKENKYYSINIKVYKIKRDEGI